MDVAFDAGELGKTDDGMKYWTDSPTKTIKLLPLACKASLKSWRVGSCLRAGHQGYPRIRAHTSSPVGFEGIYTAPAPSAAVPAVGALPDANRL